MDKPISKGEFDAGQGLLLAFLAVGLFFLSWFFFRASFTFRFLQIDRLIVATIFTCLFTYLLIKVAAAQKAVDIYRSHLKLKWLWGLISVKVYPSDVTQFGVSHTQICLRKGATDFLLTTRFMNNDLELIEQLKLWRVKRKDNMRFNEISSFERRLGNSLIMIICGILCIVGFYKSCMEVHKPIQYGSLVKIYGHLVKPPGIHKSKNSYSSIELKLDEYPSIGFEIGMMGVDRNNVPVIKNYQPGTPVTLWIMKDAYQKKIAQTAEPRFSERHFNWNRIETYEAELNGNKILELNKYNKAADELAANNKGWAFPLILVFVIVFYALRHSPTK